MCLYFIHSQGQTTRHKQRNERKTHGTANALNNAYLQYIMNFIPQHHEKRCNHHHHHHQCWQRFLSSIKMSEWKSEGGVGAGVTGFETLLTSGMGGQE